MINSDRLKIAFRMSTEERTKWAAAFKKIGYSLEQVLAMSNTEFVNRRDYLEFEGFKPGPIQEQTDEEIEAQIMKEIMQKGKQKKDTRNQMQNHPNPNRARIQAPPPVKILTKEEIDRMVADQEANIALVQEQNQNYRTAVDEKQKDLDSLKAEITKVQNSVQEVIDNSKNIPPEPEKSSPGAVTIAIQLPNGNRIIRNFLKTEKAQNLIYWASEKIMNMEKPPVIREFDLRTPLGDVIDKDQTLESQGITARTMLNAIIHKL